MNSRKSFIYNSSLLTIGLSLIKPSKTIGAILQKATDADVATNKIFLLHTSNTKSKTINSVKESVKKLKFWKTNAVHIHYTNQNDCTLFNHSDVNFAQSEINYKIIKKGAITIGVINNLNQNNDLIASIDSLAKHLKLNLQCNIVTYLSDSGFKNSNSIDDITIANNSQYIDIILGTHETNYCKNPYVALNKKRAEVIINHAAVGREIDLGKISIEFDDNGAKKNIQFIRK